MSEQEGIDCPQCHRWVKSSQDKCLCGWKRGTEAKSYKTPGYKKSQCSVHGCHDNGTFAGPDGERLCSTHELERIDRDRLKRYGIDRPTFAKGRS